MATSTQNLKYFINPKNYIFWQEINKSREFLGFKKIYSSKEEFIKDNIIYSASELKKIIGGNFTIKNNTIIISLKHENGVIDLVSAKKIKIPFRELRTEAKRIIRKFQNKFNNDEQSINAIIDCIIFDQTQNKNVKLLDILWEYKTKPKKQFHLKLFKNAKLNDFKDYWRLNKKIIDRFQNLVEEGKLKIIKKSDHIKIVIYSNTTKQNIIDIWTQKITPLLMELPGYHLKNRPLDKDRYDKFIESENEYVKRRHIDKTQPYKITSDDRKEFGTLEKKRKKKIIKRLK
jgi:hypothetical protein